ALKRELTLETLWDWLLFDNLPPILDKIRTAVNLVGRLGLFSNKGDDKTKEAGKGVFRRMLKAGEEVVHGAEAGHEHIDFPVRKVALFVEGSPWVALLLRAVARNLHRLEGMSLAEFGLDKAADMIAEVQQMYLRFEQVTGGLSQYELPDTLVPLEAI